MLWRCKLCRMANPGIAVRCTVCKKNREGGEELIDLPDQIRPRMRTDPQLMEERREGNRQSQEILIHLGDRLKEATTKLGKVAVDSIPPKTAIHIVVPNDWTGWLTVGIVVLGLAVALAIIRSFF